MFTLFSVTSIKRNYIFDEAEKVTPFYQKVPQEKLWNKQTKTSYYQQPKVNQRSIDKSRKAGNKQTRGIKNTGYGKKELLDKVAKPLTPYIQGEKARIWNKARNNYGRPSYQYLYRNNYRNGFFDSISHSISDVVDTVSGAASTAADAISGAVSTVADTASQVASAAVDTVSGAASTAADAISGAVSTVADTASQAASTAADAISGAASQAASTVADAAFSVAGKALDAVGDDVDVSLKFGPAAFEFKADKTDDSISLGGKADFHIGDIGGSVSEQVGVEYTDKGPEYSLQTGESVTLPIWGLIDGTISTGFGVEAGALGTEVSGTLGGGIGVSAGIADVQIGGDISGKTGDLGTGVGAEGYVKGGVYLGQVDAEAKAYAGVSVSDQDTQPQVYTGIRTSVKPVFDLSDPLGGHRMDSFGDDGDDGDDSNQDHAIIQPKRIPILYQRAKQK